MPRVSWLNDDNAPQLDERAQCLEHFTTSMADGVIDNDELQKQEENLVAAMKAVEGDLSDEVHERVTTLLVELTAFNVMSVLHDFASARARKAFG